MIGVFSKILSFKNWLKTYFKNKDFQDFIPGINFSVISSVWKLTPLRNYHYYWSEKVGKALVSTLKSSLGLNNSVWVSETSHLLSLNSQIRVSKKPPRNISSKVEICIIMFE